MKIPPGESYTAPDVRIYIEARIHSVALRAISSGHTRPGAEEKRCANTDKPAQPACTRGTGKNGLSTYEAASLRYRAPGRGIVRSIQHLREGSGDGLSYCRKRRTYYANRDKINERTRLARAALARKEG